MTKIKCHSCIHLETVEPDDPNYPSFSCKKLWFGGCSEISTYGARICAQQNKDFKPKN